MNRLGGRSSRIASYFFDVISSDRKGVSEEGNALFSEVNSSGDVANLVDLAYQNTPIFPDVNTAQL